MSRVRVSAERHLARAIKHTQSTLFFYKYNYNNFMVKSVSIHKINLTQGH